MISIQKKLEQAHPGYAYELLQLQMAVEDEKIGCQPSITEITRLIQLYMIGVQVLQSISDSRFVFFHNKIHALMLKKHIVKKLHEESGKQQPPQSSLNAINKAQLKDKKDQYEINCYFNQGRIDMKKVKEMLNLAQNKKAEAEVKIKTDLKKQQDRLQQRIKQRKMRSEAGSVKKYNVGSDQEVPSPTKKQVNKDPRMEYFNLTDYKFNDMLPKSKAVRTNSGSLQKTMLDRKYGLRKQLTGIVIGGNTQKQQANEDGI